VSGAAQNADTDQRGDSPALGVIQPNGNVAKPARAQLNEK
jgi:hypothetical protein